MEKHLLTNHHLQPLQHDLRRSAGTAAAGNVDATTPLPSTDTELQITIEQRQPRPHTYTHTWSRPASHTRRMRFHPHQRAVAEAIHLQSPSITLQITIITTRIASTNPAFRTMDAAITVRSAYLASTLCEKIWGFLWFYPYQRYLDEAIRLR